MPKQHTPKARLKLLLLPARLLLLCFLLLLLIEIGLRITGYGEEILPLRRITVKGEGYYVPNKAFYQQFSDVPIERIANWDELDFQIPVKKNADEARMLVFGGADAYGKRSSARWIEHWLAEDYRRYDKSLYVYSFAFPGMSSRVMAEIAASCDCLKPDYFLVYLGINECLGLCGYRPEAAPPPSFKTKLKELIPAPLVHLRLLHPLLPEKTPTWRIPNEPAVLDSLNKHNMDERLEIECAENLNRIYDSARKSRSRALLCLFPQNKSLSIDDAPFYIAETSRKETKLAFNEICAKELPAWKYFCAASVARNNGLIKRIKHPNFDDTYMIDNIENNDEYNEEIAGMILYLLPDIPDSLLDCGIGTYACCSCKMAIGPATQFWETCVEQPHYLDRPSPKFSEPPAPMLDEQLTREQIYHTDFLEDASKRCSPMKIHLAIVRDAIEIYLLRGKIDEALQLALETLEDRPASRIPYRCAGKCYAALGEKDKAISILKQGLARYPDDYESILELARIRLEQKQLKEAQALYTTVLNAYPASIAARSGLAEIYLLKGDPDQARKVFPEIDNFPQETTPKP